MSTIDQCPSSKKDGKPVEKPANLQESAGACTGVRWTKRSARASSRTSSIASSPPTRANFSTARAGNFLKIMGASLALAGAATIPGCRRPDHKILTYNKKPEDVIPGKPLYYATAMPMPGGGAQGLLAETFEGRPTKLEGNPLHPYNRGKSRTCWPRRRC